MRRAGTRVASVRKGETFISVEEAIHNPGGQVGMNIVNEVRQKADDAQQEVNKVDVPLTRRLG